MIVVAGSLKGNYNSHTFLIFCTVAVVVCPQTLLLLGGGNFSLAICSRTFVQRDGVPSPWFFYRSD